MNRRQQKKRIRMQNKKLIKKYPFLLPRNCWTGEIVDNYDYSYTLYDSISYGWRKSFGKFLLDDLKEACIKTDFLYDLRLEQIKEKYGRLTIYINAAPQEVHDVLRNYEFISECVCIHCGSPHACLISNYGWILPVCESCHNLNNKKRQERGFKISSWENEKGEQDANIPDSYLVKTFSKEGDSVQKIDISNIAKRINNSYSKRGK